MTIILLELKIKTLHTDTPLKTTISDLSRIGNVRERKLKMDTFSLTLTQTLL